MFRVQTIWNGFTGAPGYTGLYFGSSGSDDPTQSEVNTVIANVDAWATRIATLTWNRVSLTVQPTVDVIDAVTGIVHNSMTATTTPAAHTGNAQVQSGSSVSGACVVWKTGSVVGRRRLQGRSFLIPLHSQVYDADGTLAAGALTEILGASSGLISAPTVPNETLLVWHRPKAGAGGSVAAVTSASCRDQAAILTSRRQ